MCRGGQGILGSSAFESEVFGFELHYWSEVVISGFAVYKVYITGLGSTYRIRGIKDLVS